MLLPRDLVVIRHGESEGNLAHRIRRERGVDHLPLLRRVHTSQWRLTERGRAQARAAGAWLAKNFPNGFNGYYTSSYVRAKETAGLLGIPNARWVKDIMIAERNWGAIEGYSRTHTHPDHIAYHIQNIARDGMWWHAPGGESLASVASGRVHNFLRKVAERHANGSVVGMCHGETIWSIRQQVEGLTSTQFEALHKDLENHIHNCQIIHYTRKNPDDPWEIRENFAWMRSVCPWDPARSPGEWRAFAEPTFTNEELLTDVETYPRFLPKDV